MSIRELTARARPIRARSEAALLPRRQGAPASALTAIAALVCGTVTGCAAPRTANDASTALCPQLGADIDPYSLRFSASVEANGQIRAFVAAARGLKEAAEQAEYITAEACRRMGADLGLSASAMAPSGAVAVGPAPGTVAGHEAAHGPSPDLGREALAACTAVANEARVILGDGPLVIEVKPPRCEPDLLRRGRCEALCSLSGPAPAECLAACESEANIHGQCHAAELDGLDLAVEGRKGVLLATLGRNLPWLLHAQTALARRLAGDAEVLARIGAQLPELLKDAGPQGLACMTASAALVAISSRRLSASLDAGRVVLERLRLTELAPGATRPARTPAASPPDHNHSGNAGEALEPTTQEEEP